MDKIFIGYYLQPNAWVGDKTKLKSPMELAFIERDISQGIDLGIQRQGMVIACFKTENIPGYIDSDASNLLRSKTASFVLNFFNAFSFALYEAHLRKYKGAYQSVPQEVCLKDLYLWQGTFSNIQEANCQQPMPITTGEFDSMAESINKLLKTVGKIDSDDKSFRIDIDCEIMSEHLDKNILNPEHMKLFSLLNRSIVGIRSASFDTSLIGIWAVIELIIKDLWSEFLTHRSLPKKRKEFLTGRDITASILTENLNLHGIISDVLYEDISQARKARNSLMHELSPVDPSICYKAFLAVKELIKIKYGIDILHRGEFYKGNINFKSITPTS